MSISGGDCLIAVNGILCQLGGLPHRAHCGTQAFSLFQDLFLFEDQALNAVRFAGGNE